MPLVVIDKESCKNCQYCMKYCQKDVLDVSENINARGYSYVYVKNPGNCTGCAICAIICPDAAIEIFK